VPDGGAVDDGRGGVFDPYATSNTASIDNIRGRVYDTAKDRESAFELLKVRAEQATRQAEAADAEAAAAKRREADEKAWEKEQARRDRDDRAPAPRRSSSRQTMGEAFGKTLVRTIASQVGREILRGVLGSLKKR
jgi:topoisomerase IA-like protein